MPRGVFTAISKAVRTALTVVCLVVALAGSHAVVGQLNLARAASESSGTPVEELRHEDFSSVSRRDSMTLVQVTSSLPGFDLPRVTGRQQAFSILSRSLLLCPLSGGQHALRNGLGAPLLT